jgi:hypothetical protein
MRNFDLVTFLITLAGRIQEKRHSKLLAREASLKAAISAAQSALQSTVQSRVEADWRHQDIKRVK